MTERSQGDQRYKADAGKPRWSLIPVGALRQILAVLEFGARKYEPRSWRVVPGARERYVESLLRHTQDLAEAVQERGIDALLTPDPESGLPHLAAIGCNALILLDLATHRPDR